MFFQGREKGDIVWRRNWIPKTKFLLFFLSTVWPLWAEQLLTRCLWFELCLQASIIQKQIFLCFLLNHKLVCGQGGVKMRAKYCLYRYDREILDKEGRTLCDNRLVSQGDCFYFRTPLSFEGLEWYCIDLSVSLCSLTLPVHCACLVPMWFVLQFVSQLHSVGRPSGARQKIIWGAGVGWKNCQSGVEELHKRSC